MAKKITQIEINGETYNVGGSGESVSGNFINQVDDFSHYTPTKLDEIAQYVGADTPQYKNGYFYKFVDGEWTSIEVQSSLKQCSQLLKENQETIVQYIGKSNSNYKHGYLYEAQSTRIFHDGLFFDGIICNLNLLSPMHDCGSIIFCGMLLDSPTQAGYGIRYGKVPEVGVPIYDFRNGTIDNITTVTEVDGMYMCRTNSGSYVLDIAQQFEYPVYTDDHGKYYITADYSQTTQYGFSTQSQYFDADEFPIYPTELYGAHLATFERSEWQQVYTQARTLYGNYLGNHVVSIVPVVEVEYINGELHDPTTDELIQPESDVYYYEIHNVRVYTLDGGSDELIDVSDSVLVHPEENQLVVIEDDSGNTTAYCYHFGFHQLKDDTKAPDAPTFSAAQTRENIKGDGTEDTATLWGKVKKFFADLKIVAFSGSYNDLSNKPLSVTNNQIQYTAGSTVFNIPRNADNIIDNAILLWDSSNKMLKAATKWYTFGNSTVTLSSKCSSETQFFGRVSGIFNLLICQGYISLNEDMASGETIVTLPFNVMPGHLFWLQDKTPKHIRVGTPNKIEAFDNFSKKTYIYCNHSVICLE